MNASKKIKSQLGVNDLPNDELSEASFQPSFDNKYCFISYLVKFLSKARIITIFLENYLLVTQRTVAELCVQSSPTMQRFIHARCI